jgi:hypothetical protein
MTTATDGKQVYTTKRRDDAMRGYSSLPRGLAGPIPGLGVGKWFLNCAHGDRPFICPSCRHGFAGIHKRGGVCIDCSTERVMLRGSWLENELGINLGCHTANIDGGRNVAGRRTGRQTHKTNFRNAI